MSSPLFMPSNQPPATRWALSGALLLGSCYLSYWAMEEWPPTDPKDGWQNLFFVVCTFAFAVHVAFLAIEEMIYTYRRQRLLVSGHEADASKFQPGETPAMSTSGKPIAERRIAEDFKIYWPVMYLISAAVIAMLLCLTVMSNEVVMDRVLPGVLVCVGILGWMCLRLGLRDRLVAGKHWRLTNAGLQRVYPSGRTEVIGWGQIREPRWVRFKGLVFQWEEATAAHSARCAEFREEWQADWARRAYRARLLVQREEARAVLEAMAAKKG